MAGLSSWRAVRTLPACLLFVLALSTQATLAAPPSVEKRLSRRAETGQLVQQVLEGSLPVPTAI
jgi:hypothetical protein